MTESKTLTKKNQINWLNADQETFIPDCFDKDQNFIIKKKTRSPGTTSVCFSVVTVNDEHRKPEFKINRWGVNLKRTLV